MNYLDWIWIAEIIAIVYGSLFLMVMAVKEIKATKNITAEIEKMKKETAEYERRTQVMKQFAKDVISNPYQFKELNQLLDEIGIKH